MGICLWAPVVYLFKQKIYVPSLCSVSNVVYILCFLPPSHSEIRRGTSTSVFLAGFFCILYSYSPANSTFLLEAAQSMDLLCSCSLANTAGL